ncbi:hypothetical protein OG883_44345 [Streptomyces sp. NBC_01142]|uniref:hypothetical protein n=1 Tax=Streptomyces sp. NBC_01142 TaxID=2975865 RepID=UPI00225B0EDB|nr:hypothetical protein [Streptomyces sp. NBC_01142]MCX4826675.1 hypothetical protein [Streptomyces sp. NBC_01142]
MKRWVSRQRILISKRAAGLRGSARRQRRALRKETDSIVESMPVPSPFDLDEFIENIERARGRSIHLIEIPDQLIGLIGVCGLWIKHRTKPFDFIFHAGSKLTFHGQQIILHELVHLWVDDADGVTDGELDQLHGGLLVEMVERLIANGQVAARRDYANHKEIRTEAAASRLHELDRTTEFIEDTTARRLAEDFSYPLGRP